MTLRDRLIAYYNEQIAMESERIATALYPSAAEGRKLRVRLLTELRDAA